MFKVAGTKFFDSPTHPLLIRRKQLRLQLFNDPSADLPKLRKTPNELLHSIRARCLELANKALDHQAEAIESLSNTTRVYEATRALFRRPNSRQLIRDKQVAADTVCRPLKLPIAPSELELAFRRLKNDRAAGPDEVPAELLKYDAEILAKPLATTINDGFATGHHVQLGAHRS
ncbi:hypothetical protein PR002_g22784 [Phytophthora rubi]|uniref:Reverse transcriptase domain-containing protein n=1 Tax=Phytophthora rubi TaxID=129364 RepID=A0A6A3IS94_9STRA|nr:hypothetical protein PR002_g22784 [Phytophthora rubi]